MQATSSLFSHYFIKDKHFYQRALILIIPVVLQNCINQGVNMMDTIMVGRLGEVAISASSLANQFYLIFTFLCMGFSAAGLVLASQYWGAGDVQAVKKVFDLVLQLVIVAGVFFAMLSALIPEKIMSIYTNDQNVILAGSKYLRITALIYIPHGLSLVTSNVIRSVGNAKLGLYVSIVSFFVNIGCNYIFIFGKLGLPAMGVMGAAVGTFCARAVELTVCVVYMLRCETKLHYNPITLLKLPHKQLVDEFVRLGLPAVISDSILALAASAISIILGHMGKEIVSAYAIVTVMDRMCTVAITGVSSASGVIIGQSIGEGKLNRAMKEGYSFLIMSVALGALGAVLVFLVGRWSVSLYNIAPGTVSIAYSMMDASAIVVFFQAVQSTLSKGILRGGGDTKFLMVADVLFQWVVSIPIGYLAGLVLNLPPFWVLIALRLDYIIKSIWLVFRLRSRKWIHPVKKIG